MYKDGKNNRKGVLLVVCLCILAAAAALFAFSGSGADLDEEAAEAIRDAVRRSALQCYVVEGVYPPDLDYLKEHYGLQVNTDDYYVVYDVFASNVAPDISVIRK